MRILITRDLLGNGGSERQMALFADSLLDEHAVEVLALEDGPFRGVMEDLGVTVRVIPRRHRADVSPAAGLWSAARAFDPDIVHAWSWMSAAAMVPWCRANGVPLINGSIRRGAPPPSRVKVRRLVLSLSDAVVANSRAGLRANRIPEGEGHVVYNAFDAVRLADLPDIGRDRSAGAATGVVMAARMVPGKDWRGLLRVARTLSGTEPGGWRFTLIGEGRDRAALLADGVDLIEAGVVEFLARDLEVLPLVATADVGVLLTEAEGCSNSIMEYMACGLPVVCSAVGGNPELVTDGEHGLLVPFGDEDATVSALRRLRGEPGLAAAMGDAGRRRMLDDFGIARMVEGYLDVYAAAGAAGRRAATGWDRAARDTDGDGA